MPGLRRSDRTHFSLAGADGDGDVTRRLHIGFALEAEHGHRVRFRSASTASFPVVAGTIAGLR